MLFYKKSIWQKILNSLIPVIIGFILFLWVQDAGSQTQPSSRDLSSALEQDAGDQSRDNTYIRVLRNNQSLLVSLDIKEKRLSDALSELAAEAGIGISFRSYSSVDRKVSLRLSDAPFYEVVYALLENTGMTPDISENGRVLVIRDVIVSPSEDNPQVSHATLSGRITDAVTGEPLIGANIILQNTAIGTATDLQGYFHLQRIPAGERVLVVRYLGYVTKEIRINGSPGQELQRDISLQPDQVEGEEIIIYTQALGQARAIRQQLNSNTIVNVVSETRLRELPDANAAESVGRLPGVSVLRDAGEGQKVAIRGMGPRYSSITIDGNRVPGTDGDRSVDLSMISPEMLSGIEV